MKPRNSERWFVTQNLIAKKPWLLSKNRGAKKILEKIWKSDFINRIFAINY